MSRHRAVLPLLMLAAAASPARAQDKLADQRVEISAQPTSDADLRRRDPVAKTVYGRDELDKYGDGSVSEVLKRLPGVNMQGGAPRLRGMAGGYTQLLVNGEPAPPGFSLDNLSPGQVERIEITRGPSAEHSAQAVAGTLNIILREAPRSRQRELSARLGYQALRPTLSANGSWGDRLSEGAGALSFTVPAAFYQWRGQADSVGLRQWGESLDGGPPQPQRHRVVGSDRYWGGGFNIAPRLSWKLGENGSLSWQSFAQRHRFNNSGSFVTEVLAGAPPLSVDDRFASGGQWQMLRSGLQWNRRSDDGTRLELKVGFQASSSRSHNHTVGDDAAGLQTLTRDSDNHNLERSLSSAGKISRPLGEAHALTLGWDLERRERSEQRRIVQNGADLLAGYEGQPFDATVLRSALFVQDEWELAARWSTSLGLRAERIATTSSGLDSRSSHTSQVLTPVWHLNHKLSATGRDLLRASLTRSYKAPELGQLSSRPSINTLFPVDGPSNPAIAPDSVGNPALKPELATGLDLALETYLAQGGVISIGGFHRRINGLIRNQVALLDVPWSPNPRQVSRPVNLSHATSTGLELELKGRGDELLGALTAGQAWLNGLQGLNGLKGLSLRAAASVYRSSVDGIPGPDNRLAQQPPWSASAGFDQVLGPLWGAASLTVGASLAWLPGYRTQQDSQQALTVDRVRTLDAYALWGIDKQTSLRVSANNLLADATRSLTELQPDSGTLQSSDNSRSSRRSFNVGLSLKF